MKKLSKTTIIISLMGLFICYLFLDNQKAWSRVREQERYLKDTYAAAKGIADEKAKLERIVKRCKH